MSVDFFSFFFFFLTWTIFKVFIEFVLGFTGSSAGKESACNARDPGLIPWLERSSGEGNGNPLQCSYVEIPRIEEPGRLQSMG